jgi:hypothetical protein
VVVGSVAAAAAVMRELMETMGEERREGNNASKITQ